MSGEVIHVRAKTNRYGLKQGAAYDVVERDVSFVAVRDFDGNVFGRGQAGGPFEGRCTIGFDNFEILFTGVAA